MRALALVVLVACGGGGSPSPQKPAATAISCAAAADGMVGMLVAAMNPKPPDEDADGLRKLVIERCDRDQWSPEARRCLKDMKTADDANVCGTLLSDDQQAALVKAQQEKYGAKQP